MAQKTNQEKKADWDKEKAKKDAETQITLNQQLLKSFTENHELSSKILRLNDQIERLHNEVEKWKEQYESMKKANVDGLNMKEKIQKDAQYWQYSFNELTRRNNELLTNIRIQEDKINRFFEENTNLVSEVEKWRAEASKYKEDYKYTRKICKFICGNKPSDPGYDEKANEFLEKAFNKTKDIPSPKDIGMYPYKETPLCGTGPNPYNTPSYKFGEASELPKPPIGLRPKYIFDTQKRRERITEIESAFARYFNANKEIPFDWIAEYNDLVEPPKESYDCEETDFIP